MKALDYIIPVLVLLIAFGAIYYLYVGAGLATGYRYNLVASGGSVSPSEFRMDTRGVIAITNQGSGRTDVEITKEGKVVFRRGLYPGQMVTYKADPGTYRAGILCVLRIDNP